ncbi:MAG: hypothetical protein D6705_15650 [Deltaproteobacteria bacterium]|nr:MAG: hypothetical protein D6705_15650 [Deltaproteobacteria bacterium]
MAPSDRRIVLGLLLWVGACGASRDEARQPRPAAVRGTDKARGFASPLLLPSRASERIRQEVARAAEIEALARKLPAVEEVRADVELPDRCGRPASITVVAIGSADLEADVARIARGVVPEAPPDGIVVRFTVRDSAPPSAPTAPPVLPVVAVSLALGASLGVFLERLRIVARHRRRLRRLHRA